MKLSEKKLKELKDKKISVEDLYEKYLYTEKDGVNVENVLKLLDENICNFEELVDRYKSIKDQWNKSCLYKLLWNEELFEKLIENNTLTKDDLECLWNEIDKRHELDRLNDNTFLLQYMIDNDIISFQELVDKFKSMDCLYILLDNKKLLKELIQNNKLTIDNLKYLLNEIDKWYELRDLCKNTSLIKNILNECVFDKELVDKFNRWIKKIEYWYKDRNIHNVFDLIEYKNKNNEDGIDKELLELNELNRYKYSFNLNDNQKLELSKLIQNNEIAQNRLSYIVDNNLESNYDFDSLMNYLKKQEKRNLINI